jgi:hypothetical protein
MNETEIKECKHHGNTDFVLRADGAYRCKKCAVGSVMNRRALMKRKAIEYKGGKCERCGYNTCDRALAFHHLDPSQKEFSISRTNKGWEKMKIELDKCILVCCNCHMEIHDEIEKEKNNPS